MDLDIEYCGGMFPNQAWGKVNGRGFYFRARHGEWTLQLADGSWEEAAKSVDSVARGCDFHAGGWEKEETERRLLDALKGIFDETRP